MTLFVTDPMPWQDDRELSHETPLLRIGLKLHVSDKTCKIYGGQKESRTGRQTEQRKKKRVGGIKCQACKPNE